MGTSRSAFELAGKFARLEHSIGDAARDGVRAGALFVRGAVDRELTQDVPSRRLRSGAQAGRSTGRALSVRSEELRSDPNNPAAIVRARGPWQVFERDTRAHTIRVRRGSSTMTSTGRVRTRRSGAKALRFGGRFATSVRHPGARGKHTFRDGVTKAAPAVPRLVSQGMHKAMARIFR